MLIKALILILLLLMLASLAAGGYFLLHDRGQSNRLVNSLTTRVLLHLTLLLIIILALSQGALQPNHPWGGG